MFSCLFFTLFIVIEGESGNGGPEVEMPKVELPTCKVGDQGQDMTWADIIKSLNEDMEDVTKLWNKDFQVLDKNATKFIHSMNRFVYMKAFSCLPRYLSLNSDLLCDCKEESENDNDTDNNTESPLSDEGDSKGDKNGKQGWIHKIKEMIKKVKVTVNSSIEAWTIKDSFLFFCSTPGLISAVTQLARFCLKKRLKNVRI